MALAAHLAVRSILEDPDPDAGLTAQLQVLSPAAAAAGKVTPFGVEIKAVHAVDLKDNLLLMNPPALPLMPGWWDAEGPQPSSVLLPSTHSQAFITPWGAVHRTTT